MELIAICHTHVFKTSYLKSALMPSLQASVRNSNYLAPFSCHLSGNTFFDNFVASAAKHSSIWFDYLVKRKSKAFDMK